MATIVGVVFGWECVVGVSMGPMVDVGENELPQAASKSINSKRNGKPSPNRKGKPTPNPQGDRKGAPLLYTTFAVAPYLLTSEGPASLEGIMEISPVVASSMVIRSGVSLLHRDSKHPII